MIDLLTPRRGSQFCMVYSEPHRRPPVLEEMMEDIGHVITSIATRYTDPSCPQLNFDDLKAEGYLKLSEIIDSGRIARLPTRTEFFKFFKTAVNNHVKGLVHRHRYTIKRTGNRPPPKEDRYNFNPDSLHESTKPIEVSLDDPDSHIQLSDTLDHGGLADSELMEDLTQHLTPLETLVLKQLAEPNPQALCHAQLDAYRGKKPGSVKVRVRYEHMALGLGLPLETFNLIQEHVKTKVTAYMQQQSDSFETQTKYSAAVAALSDIFAVQIPPSIDKMIVRRLLTIAARDQIDKVSSQVREMLAVVGARCPEVKGNTVSCYGVLYHAQHKVCGACGMKEACKAEALNYGLGEVMLTAKFLGSRGTRVPILVANKSAEVSTISDEPGQQAPAGPACERDDEVFAHLCETFKQVLYTGETYLRHKEKTPSGKVKYIFWYCKTKTKFELRFCNPSDAIAKDLEKRKNGFYLKDNCSASEAIDIINRHATEKFT